MEKKKINKILLIIGCVVIAIILSIGTKVVIDYANKDLKEGVNEEKPLGDCGTGCASCVSGQCQSCASGYYGNNWGSGGMNCVSCGSHCTACNSSGVCTSCASGYKLSGGSCVLSCAVLNCSSCASGSQTTCATCNSGYSLIGGSCELQSCPAGQYNNGSGCQSCSNGNYCPSGSTSQNACPAGSYCPTPSQKLPCPANFYCPLKSATPQPCDPNKVTNEGEGKSASDCKLKTCNPGYYANGRTCLSCDAGYYCTGGTAQPTSCGSGYTSSAGASSSNGCAPLTVTCSPSSVNEGGESTCTLRINGNVQSTGVTWSATRGTISTLGKVTNITAGADPVTITASYGGTSKTATITVISCPAGKYLDNGSCKPCRPGYYCPAQGANEQPCVVNNYCPEGSATPTACPAGTTSPVRSDSSSDCTSGSSGGTTSCPAGKYLDNGQCSTCPVGSFCTGGTAQPTSCGAGYTSSAGASSSNGCAPLSVTCTPSSINVGATSTCTLRVNGNVQSTGVTWSTRNGAVVALSSGSIFNGVSPGKTNIRATYGGAYKEFEIEVVSTNCPAGQYFEGGRCISCPAGSYCTGGTSAPTQCSNNTYNPNTGSTSSSSCLPCTTQQNGTTVTGIVNSDHSSCVLHPPCSKGYFMGQITCEACPAGYYCDDGSSKTKCPNGLTSNLKATDRSECYEKAAQSECNVSTSISSQHVSVDSDGNNNNSYYAVKVTVTGNGCSNGQKLMYSATNAKSFSPSSVSNLASGATYYFNVYPKDACKSSSATATLTNGNSSTSSINTVLQDWDLIDGKWSISDVAGKPIGSHTADNAGVNEYYDKLVNGYYTIHAVRVGCGSSGTSTPTYACYKDDANHYTWATSAPAGYALLSGITQANCKDPSSTTTTDPTYACYKNDAGHYTWATSMPTGYTKLNGVGQNECHEPDGGTGDDVYACYKDANNNYQWAVTAPSGYTLVTSIAKEEDCKVTDNAACYKDNKQNYVWGTYSGNGYTLMSEIKTSEKCIAPAACYKDNQGNYVWGQYGNNSSYTLVRDIVSKDKCKPNAVNVPPTAAKVSTIIYISIAVVATVGGSIMYYIYKKKTNLK